LAERPIRRSPLASSFRTSARSPKRADPSSSLCRLAARLLMRQLAAISPTRTKNDTVPEMLPTPKMPSSHRAVA